MAKITTRAGLVVGTELTIDETLKTFMLNVAGNLIAKDGVTLQALYSKFVELWATASYQDSQFPMYSIDALSGQFQFGTDGSTFSGWKPANDATRQMLRDGGWSEFSSAGVLNRQYVGIVSLGGVSSGAQLYYQRALAGAAANFTFSDAANEGIQVFGDATNGAFDTRTYFKGYVREYGKKYKDSILADTGKTATGAYLVNLLLSNEDDLKILANDAAMTGAPYNNINITYFATDQNRLIGGTNYPFRVIVAGNGATLEQIYTKVQFLLRQSTDIDSGAGTVTGKTAAALMAFVGDTLQTTQGVYIDNIQAGDSNRITFQDQNGIVRSNPYSSAGTITFNSVLVGAGSSYRMMYTTGPGALDDYGQSGAITVLDAAAAPITGVISSGSISFSFNYDSDTAGGPAGTDKPVTIIGIKPGTGKFVVATGVLTRSKAIALSLVSEQDRAYL
jgi:hypothetical protein